MRKALDARSSGLSAKGMWDGSGDNFAYTCDFDFGHDDYINKPNPAPGRGGGTGFRGNNEGCKCVKSNDATCNMAATESYFKYWHATDCNDAQKDKRDYNAELCADLEKTFASIDAFTDTLPISLAKTTVGAQIPGAENVKIREPVNKGLRTSTKFVIATTKTTLGQGPADTVSDFMTSGIKQATVFSKRRISQDVRDEDQEKVEVEQVKTSKFSKSKDSFIVEPIKKIQRRKNMGLDAIPDAMAEYLNEPDTPPEEQSARKKITDGLQEVFVELEKSAQ